MSSFFRKSRKSHHSSAVSPVNRSAHSVESPPGHLPTSTQATRHAQNGVLSRDPGHPQSLALRGREGTNSSLDSVGERASPDQRPDQMRQRRERSDSDAQMNRTAPAINGSQTPSPTHSLYPWSQRRINFTSHGTPFPRYGAAANATASKEGDIYLMGGLVDTTTIKGDLWIVDSTGGAMTCSPVVAVTEGPSPRVGHASLLVGNAFIVFGGDTKIGDGDTLDDSLYLLNTSSRQWSRAVPPGPRPAGRYGHTMNILGSKIYIFGGQADRFFFNDLVAFDLNLLQNPQNKWEFLIQSNDNEDGFEAPLIPPPRTNHSIVSFNDRLYLFGGTNGRQWFNDVWSYDPRTNSWTRLDCVGLTPSAREGHAAALVGDVMYIFGGRTETVTDLGDLAAFRITTRRWYTFQNMGPSPSPRSGHSMTTFGKQIIVLGGEPSTAPRDPEELSLVYILDTSKIRYMSNEPPSQDRSGSPYTQPPRRLAGPPSVGRVGTPESIRRGPVSGRESAMKGEPGPPVAREEPNGPGPAMRGDPTSPNSGPMPGPRPTRLSIAQAPSGPPPSGQPPNPRGPIGDNSPANKPPPRSASRNANNYPDREITQSPSLKDLSGGARSGEHAPGTSGGRRTPTPQSSRVSSARAMEAGEAAPLVTPARQRSLRGRHNSSIDSADDSIMGRTASSIDEGDTPRSRRSSRTLGDEVRSQRLTAHQEALVKEIDTIKNKNAWLTSELALARKAGYVINANGSVFDEHELHTFKDEDRPLIEAFLAMRADLAKMQAAVDRQAATASKRVAEVEHQRDVAVSEAAFAQAKLAAHRGSLVSTPQGERIPQDLESAHSERSTDLSRKLALALVAQSELKTKVETLSVEIQEERRARELAEELQEATDKRVTELEQNSNAIELESLKTELHRLQTDFRQESSLRSEAEAILNLVEIDKKELEQQLEELKSRLQSHNESIGPLHEAVSSSAAKANLLESQLQEERAERDALVKELAELRASHNQNEIELGAVSRKLQETLELAESHAKEAEAHKSALLSGLARVASPDSETTPKSLPDERIVALRTQIDRANELVKSHQAAANAATEKLWKAEERIAGLEAYQEQTSREGLNIRRQLQAALKDNQAISSDNRDIRSQLESHQRDANALAIQHGALKDLLGDRGWTESRRSPRLGSPNSRFGTPEHSRVRELEQQLQASAKANEESKTSFEQREQEADRVYHEKLEQLENDYQSAVHYVKGTEKMLKRMADELTKYKGQNSKLQTELNAAHRNGDSPVQAEWIIEKNRMESLIKELQTKTSSSVAGLESQLSNMKEDLAATKLARDESVSSQEKLREELAKIAEQNHAELEFVKKENESLEARALDAEHKVGVLLDQVESSVTNFRRQSQQQYHGSGLSRSHSTASNDVVGRHRADSHTSSQDDVPFIDNRGSIALDSLASELDALRSHWESTNRSYRLSSQLDFERTPTKDNYGDTPLSDSLADWRRRLDEEERAHFEKTTGPP